jgi:carboxyl-terminal processing protease
VGCGLWALGSRLALGILVAASAADAQDPKPQAATRPRTLAEDLQLFSQVLNQIRVNHPDSMNAHAVLMAAIEGMVRATDPHSFVIPAVRLDSARQRALESGKLAPVPIAFAYSRGTPIVVSVVLGTQAARQNILAGDELVAIDGAPVSAESSEELDIVLAGQKGSTTSLRLQRRRLDGSTVTLERSVKRERPDEQTAVPVAEMLDAETGYIRVTTFANTKVADDVNDALKRLEKAGMKRLLLDLRDNGGGIVDEAANVAGNFLEKGAVVYVATGRKDAVNRTLKVSRSFWSRERSYPVVVLVDRGTASAAELVAGALQDHDRALIVGRPTFGKALLMQGMPLTDGSWMMLVVGHVKTPCGRVVQRQYRGVRHSDYLRDAGSVQDTAGRPSCKTPSGRMVYGGGGIFPDVVLNEPASLPIWLARLDEAGLPFRWASAYADSAGAVKAVPRAVDVTLSDNAIAQFRAFARPLGGDVPTGAEADAMLKQHLTPLVARFRAGEGAYYRALASNDPWISAALAAFVQASQLKR